MALGEQWRRSVRDELALAADLRCRIHHDPRVSGDETDTAQAVAAAIGLPADPIADTGLLFDIPTAAPAAGRPIVLRSELDALPLTEQTGVPWSSSNGAMHACGHDIHLAAVTAVARAARTLDLPAPLKILLQPREEDIRSGAGDIVATGVPDSFAAIIAAHVQPQLSAGVFSITPGTVNAGVGDLEILIEGQGGHSGYPHTVADPILALAAVITASQQIAARRTDPTTGSVVMITTLAAGSASNAVPAAARASGSYRFMTETDRVMITESLSKIVSGIGAAHQVTGTVRFNGHQPPLNNNPALAERAATILSRTGSQIDRTWRSFGSDDFSHYSRSCPALMIFVGTGECGGGLHDPHYLPPDSTIVAVADALIAGYLAAAAQPQPTATKASDMPNPSTPDPATPPQFTIDGSRIHDIPSFYAELSRVLMPDSNWQLGQNLDALDDLLSGGVGALSDGSPVRIVWTDHDASRQALGTTTTENYYQHKADHGTPQAKAAAERALSQLRAGRGRTYYDLVQEVFADHPEIDLELD